MSDFNPKQNSILVLDDLMTEAGKDEKILRLFDIDSHHLNLTVFFLTQTISLTISLNCQYIILTNNPRDRNQLVHLVKLIFPKNTQFFIEAYNDAVTERNFGYLLLALNQKTLEENRLQTGILPYEMRIIYKKKLLK
jgi:hypothetical protein